VIEGDGSARPLMLLNHTDVVPVERQYWEVEPFAGLIKDGCIWGRGALDMKGLGVSQLLTFLLIKRQGLPLARDLVFFAVADEEAGSQYGIEWLERHHPGRWTRVRNQRGRRSCSWRRASCSRSPAERPSLAAAGGGGQPGHGSVPHDDNALDRIVRALSNIQGGAPDERLAVALSLQPPPARGRFQGRRHRRGAPATPSPTLASVPCSRTRSAPPRSTPASSTTSSPPAPRRRSTAASSPAWTGGLHP
jgi:hypothetical protein